MAWFKSGYKQTDTKDRTASFTQAGTRENIRSGEKHKTLFGKIAKYFSDLKPVAFTGSYNDLQDKPSNLAPAAHRHSKSDITDFPSSLPASDVYEWAKSSSKPSYTAGEVGAVNKTGDNISGIYRYYYDNSHHVITSLGHGSMTPYGEFIKLKLANGLRQDVSAGEIIPNGGFEFTIHKATDVKDDISPWAYGRGTLGYGNRWNQIYAVNGTIQTSDRNEKKEISYIGYVSSYDDTRMADKQLIQLICGLKPAVFKRKGGESGRPHHGIIAQDFERLMEDIGLHDHAAFIKSPKTKGIEVINEDGSKEIKTQEIPGEYMYGIRYEEFISDLIRFCQLLKDENNRQQKKIEDLEKRMEILENAVKCS